MDRSKTSPAFLRRLRLVTATVMALAGSAAFAATEPPLLAPPDPSHPGIAAFVAWHAALLKGDYAAYRRLMPVVPNVSEDVQRQLFDHLRLGAPKTVMVTTPRTNRNGSLEFQSAGCMAGRPVLGIFVAGNQSGTWRVGGSGWEPSRNPKLAEHLKCP
jgi:hypothetical protein